MATLETRQSSKWWYGRWKVNGKTIVKNLNIEVEGERPSEHNPTGNRKYLQSRMAAESILNEIDNDIVSRKRTEDIAQAVYTARTGKKVSTIALSDMFAAWKVMPRKRQNLSSTYISFAKGLFDSFITFLSQHHKEAVEMCDVTHEMAEGFLNSEKERGIGGRTYNAKLMLLRGAFKHLKRKAGIIDNPFEGIVSVEENTLHRIPYTPDELANILDAAAEDDFCRPLFIAGICTAMRRGDICCLRWADVDMEQRFITVKTNKTGITVSIPMFPMLHRELGRLPRSSEFCFPEQADLYLNRPDALASKLKAIFIKAGFDIDETEEKEKAKPLSRKRYTNQEMLKIGRDKLDACSEFTPKVRKNIPLMFESYMAGNSLNDIATEFGCSKSTASNYLKRIEKIVGFPVIRMNRPENVSKRKAKTGKRKKRKPGQQGLKRVNQRGFHAFRATWVTLALTAGVPVDLVRKVTGHTTVDTVMTHYFQPGREDFRRAIQTAMPTLLTGGERTRDEQLIEIVMNINSENWGEKKAQLLELLNGVSMN